MTEPLALYDLAFGHFASAEQTAVRQETYGEDLGQTSWMTAGEWRRFADRLDIRSDTDVLEIASGSGGPAVHLAVERGCRITGIDINPQGTANGERLARGCGVAERAHFVLADGARGLPFAPESFDVIMCYDGMCHLDDRLNVLREWHRLLRPGGRMLFTDALVLTGPVSNLEAATRAAAGFYLFVPFGANERLIELAGFSLIEAEDCTATLRVIARRRLEAREHHRDGLIAQEGERTFTRFQAYLDSVVRMADERRLSRYAHFAAKPRGESLPPR